MITTCAYSVVIWGDEQQVWKEIGMTSGLVLCWTSTMKKPMNLWVVPSCGDHVAFDFLKELRVLLLWKWRGNRDLYLLSGMIFASAPGSTLTSSNLQPCLMTSCKVVWNDLWPLGALSGYNWPSFTWDRFKDEVRWLTLYLNGVQLCLLHLGDLLLWWSCEGLLLLLLFLWLLGLL